ncbi:MAG: peptidoglycan DD-metalloendopeptidase family protein [Bacteroidaceae bacterium]|nr:peptidoglycan DD-metalloendopeptidase family protein [Bacteroidaceae bacterium]
MKHKVLYVLLGIALSLSTGIMAQTATQDKIKQMENERAELNKKLEQSKKQVETNQRDISKQISNLNVINARLEERRKAIKNTRADINVLSKDSITLSKEISSIKKELAICKDRYAQACRFFQSQQINFNAVSFLFSAETFSQAVSRARYVREYNNSIDQLAHQILEKEVSLNSRQRDISLIKTEKVLLAQDLKKMEEQLQAEEKTKRTALTNLQNKNKQIQEQIKKQQQEINKLGKEIDRQIQLALEEERKRQEEEQRRQQEAGQVAVANVEAEKLSAEFAKQKGSLLSPITGTYLVVGKYGTRNVDGMENVQLTNLGVDLQGRSGAEARSIFQGVVSAVFQQGQGEIGILVRHGNYISVYCNLSSAKVKKGDAVAAGQSIGLINKNSDGNFILHFQLHKESVKLNPQEWIKL